MSLRSTRIGLFAVGAWGLLAAPAWAEDPLVVRNGNAVANCAVQDRAVRVRGAEVAYVDYAALARDFPSVLELPAGRAGFTTEERLKDPVWRQNVDRMLVEKFAYMSERQARLNGVLIDAAPGTFDTTKTKETIRPVGSNRATNQGGLAEGPVNVKGDGLGVFSPDASSGSLDSTLERFEQAKKLGPAGIAEFRNAGYRNGAMTLGEAIAEVSRQKMIQQLFDLRAGGVGRPPEARMKTMESYFILKLPIKDANGNPLAVLGRAPDGGRGGESLIERAKPVYRDAGGGWQTTSSGAAVDFGATLVVVPARYRRLRERFATEEEIFRDYDPIHSSPWANGHRAANRWAEDGRAGVERHLAEMRGEGDELFQADLLKARAALDARSGEIDKVVSRWLREPPSRFDAGIDTAEAIDRLAASLSRLVTKTMTAEEVTRTAALVELLVRERPYAAEFVLAHATPAVATALAAKITEGWKDILTRQRWMSLLARAQLHIPTEFYKKAIALAPDRFLRGVLIRRAPTDPEAQAALALHLLSERMAKRPVVFGATEFDALRLCREAAGLGAHDTVDARGLLRFYFGRWAAGDANAIAAAEVLQGIAAGLKNGPSDQDKADWVKAFPEELAAFEARIAARIADSPDAATFREPLENIRRRVLPEAPVASPFGPTAGPNCGANLGSLVQ